MVKEDYTNTTPLDLLIGKEEYDVKHDDRDIFLRFLTETLYFILNQNTERKEVVLYSILYALNDFTVNELSARERAKELGISHGLIPHYIKQYKKNVSL